MFKLILGIDQTGATDKKGKPKKLHCTLIDARKVHQSKKMNVYPNLYLEKLNFESINQLITNHVKDFKNQPVLICIDTAFGLPLQLNVSYKKIFETSKNYQFEGKSYGALTAFHFFNSFKNTSTSQKRKVEIITNANSVFNLKPFQRNIGCGSYRSIKDLAENMNWFNLWPFQTIKKQFVIAEGYPSHIWKNLLNIKTRDLNLLKKAFPDLSFKTTDHADSFVLAFGALKYQNQIFKKIPSTAKKEGWILGVPFE
ncbi:MAG: hypothetical protein H7235_00340 [Bdellovibrionaceae bacterium]|nr:hypothetical protein [Pseudobdellovibrionaceae bacterium]